MQPTRTVLLVALLGVAGTLGAAVFTQVWDARREERRWQREQEARREQWQREDRLRAGQQRQEVYAEFLLAVAKWASAAYALAANPGRPPVPVPDELARLAALTEHAEALCVPLRLQGSPGMADASDEVCQVMISVR